MTLRQSLRRVTRPAMPHIFRRASPLSAQWGFDRGKPVDRYYIEGFLEGYRQDIAGRTLEVADSLYTNQYGSGVTEADVLDIDSSNKEATLIADLSAPDQVPSSAFDCFILTQTLHLIYDTKSAIRNAYRLLRPGGVLLATVPSVSRIAPGVPDDCWRFTVSSCSRLFAESFGAENTIVKSYGNILTCVAFLQGIACEELSKKQLAKNDAAFPLVIGVRAMKPR
jgi:SAM-dependent methyltransferase